jgi:hypothetical protein
MTACIYPALKLRAVAQFNNTTPANNFPRGDTGEWTIFYSVACAPQVWMGKLLAICI